MFVRLFLNFQLLMAFFRAVRDPNRTEEIFKISADPRIMAGEKHEPMAAMLARSEKALEAVTSRRLGQWNTESLSNLAPNTFGYRYYRHLKDNNLEEKFYPDISPARDIDYIRLRLRQTHDIYHVLTGFDTTVEDEAGLQAFYFAQLHVRISPLILAIVVLHDLIYRPEFLPLLFEQINKGWNLGKKSALLFGEIFEDHFSDDLTAYRQVLSLDN